MDSIAAFHPQVVAWAGEERSLREIADLLNEHHGLGVDHNAVGRYCRKRGIAL